MKASELRGLSDQELLGKLEECRKELFKVKLHVKIGFSYEYRN